MEAMVNQDYQECIEKLNDLSNSWDNNENNHNQLDCNWVCVKFPKSIGWRKAKSYGAEKDYYWGWVLWSKSKNENGSNFAVEVMKIASQYGLLTRERQL